MHVFNNKEICSYIKMKIKQCQEYCYILFGDFSLLDNSILLNNCINNKNIDLLK